MDVMQCDADTGAMWIYDSGGGGDGGGECGCLEVAVRSKYIIYV
jgi:hypothetical protein